uniref:Syntaxin binding protein 4 n=1 Tax=Sphenodon punctatus TaxID=8508 RepID=A0A8D0H312_SPHPU
MTFFNTLFFLPSDSVFQIIAVSKATSLGLNVVGGINRNEGPLVYIQDVIPGSDCHKDGRLKPGDQLVSINKESMIGVSYEEAKSIISRTKLRSDSIWEIAFVREKAIPSSERPSSLLTSGGCGLQQIPVAFSLLSSPSENFAPKISTPTALNTVSSSTKTSHVSRVSFPNLTKNQTSALNYLGIQPTDEQQEDLRQQLQKDSKGTVSFGDFVQVARSLFCLQLDEAGGRQRAITFGANEIANLLDSQVVSCDLLEMDEVEKLKKERNEALKEINKLKEAKAAVEETRTLRSRIHLAEAAQRQARGMEMDYEEVIHLLEAEISELKAQLTDHSDQNKDSVPDLRKRITVLDCQLRKSESARKTFEVATEKLLQFVEVTIFLRNSHVIPLLCVSFSDRRVALSSKPLLSRLGRNGPTVTAALAAEAKELAKSVRAILEVDCDHITQTTSWIHPVTNVLNMSCTEDSEEDCIRELPDPKS